GGSGMCCAAGSTPTFRRARDHNAALISIAGERRVSQSKIIVGHEELSRFVRDALEGKGVRPEDAAVVADGLVWATLRGIDGHGVSRLPFYLRMIERGDIDVTAKPSLAQDRTATFGLDAGPGLGPV